MRQALQHLRILDLCATFPGQFMTWILAELGGDVLKIENPAEGDFARHVFKAKDQELSALFMMVNRKKRSLSLNLKYEEGKEVFKRLVKNYDILVEGFRPDVMKKLGLDYEAVKKLNKKLIYVSITGYGQNSIYRKRAGHDLNYLALAGIISITGSRTGQLAIPGTQVADIAGGSLLGLVGLLAAVIQRQATNSGQYIDVSMYDGSVLLGMLPISHLLYGIEVPMAGNNFLNGGQPFYNLYETKDRRYISLGATEKKFWEKFCQAINRSDLIDKQFGGSEIINEVSRVIAAKPQKKWIELFKDTDACCEPVLSIKDMMDSQLFKDRNLVEKDSKGRSWLRCPISGTEKISDRNGPAPKLGEHTTEVLNGLGFSERKIARLKKKGII